MLTSMVAGRELERTILADQDTYANFTFSQRYRELTSLLAGLEQSADFSHLEMVDIPYDMRYARALALYPKQAVAAIPIFMPTPGHIGMGIIDPKSKLIVVKRSAESSWGPTTWSFPMGHLEAEDTENDPDATLSAVIHNAAYLELGEEIVIRRTGGFGLLTSSFVDKKTGYLIHVMAKQLGGDNWEYPINTMTIGIGDEEEHSDIGWIGLDEFHKLSPVESGSTYVLYSALQFMKTELGNHLKTGRYT